MKKSFSLFALAVCLIIGSSFIITGAYKDTVKKAPACTVTLNDIFISETFCPEYTLETTYYSGSRYEWNIRNMGTGAVQTYYTSAAKKKFSITQSGNYRVWVKIVSTCTSNTQMIDFYANCN
jgi:hypothetical protein